MINNIRCKKGVCEKYTLDFNNGLDYAIFMIDDNGMFSCQSSFGNYGYFWSSFGDNFKEFLCNLRSDYLLTKLSKRDYFNTEEYIETCKNILIKMRHEDEINKKEAREAWNFFDKELDECGNSIDLVCDRIAGCNVLDKITWYDIWYSDFSPNKSYDPLDEYFVNNIYPEFIKVL